MLADDFNFIRSSLNINWYQCLFYCLQARGFYAVCLIRLCCFLHQTRITKSLCLPIQLIVSMLGVEFSPRTKFSSGLFIPHAVGIVIGAYSIGSRVIIMQNSTTGASRVSGDFSSSNRPSIGDDVVLGVGSVVLGGGFIGAKIIKPNEFINLTKEAE